MSWLILLIFLPGFRVEKMESISLSGAVERIDKEQKVVILNGEKIVLSSNTLIVNEEGKRLSLDDIKPNAQIVVEALRYLSNQKVEATKIIVRTSKRNVLPK
jgi:hypothetical protein